MTNGLENPQSPQDHPHDSGAPHPPADLPPVVDRFGPGGRETDPKARMWAMFCHLAGFAAFLPVVPVFGSVLGPLIVWLIKKDEYPFVDDQGREAVNFQITMLIYSAIAALLMLVCVGFVLLPAVVLADIVLIVVASIKANDGYHYRYPQWMIIRFIK
jgi:uncharacterized Tic20 family protein